MEAGTQRRAVCAWAVAVVFNSLGWAAPDVVRLDEGAAENAWQAHNSTVQAVRDAEGKTVWRWAIADGKEAVLWLNEELPCHKDLASYQRFVFEIRFAEGAIEKVWPSGMGLLPPPREKLGGEWNMFHSTWPHRQWLTAQLLFNDPSWGGNSMSTPVESLKMDPTRSLRLLGKPKGASCVIELRGCRLVRDRIRVERPYLTRPVGWPILARADGGAVYRTPYFVKNVSDRPVRVAGIVGSEHRWFRVKVEPADLPIAAGQTARFEVVAALNATQLAKIPSMTEETAVVSFVPDGEASLGYRTETFCTAPLPPGHRTLAVMSAAELAALRAQGEKAVDDSARFWLALSLADQERIPGYAGIPWGSGRRGPPPPVACPKCAAGAMSVTPRWMEARCGACGLVESNTLAANAAWVLTWSSIHQGGPSPASLGRAYLATGDERYARKAIELLTLLARHYQDLPWPTGGQRGRAGATDPPGPDAWTNGASSRWGTTASYGTSFIVQGLAELHMMVADSPSWTPEARARMYQDFWLPIVTELAKIIPGLSNMNDLINRALVLIGITTGDANVLYRGTAYPSGVLARLRDITPDGFSSEGGPLNYHRAAMNEWLPSLKLLAHSPVGWGDTRKRALAAVMMPILRADLDGIVYSTGNSGAAWGKVSLKNDLAEKVFGPEEFPRQRAFSKEPVLFRDGGWAILRRGDTAETQVTVNFDYGPSHHHGDLDRLILAIHAYKTPLSADPGSTYNFSTSASAGPAESITSGPFVHNTVVVDGKDQVSGGGELVTWQVLGKAQAASAQTASVYPGVTWRRSIVLVGGVVVVDDAVWSDAVHRYELAWHHMGDFKLAGGCQAAALDKPLGAGEYQRLLNPRRVTGSPLEAEWARQGVRLRLWQPVESGQLAFAAQTGICFDNVRGAAVDGLYTRREGKAARFVTVLEPTRGERLVRRAAARTDPTRSVVELDLADGTQASILFDAASTGDAAVQIQVR